MKKWLVLLLCVCVVLGLGYSKAQAVAWVKGDVFAGIGGGQVAIFDQSGALLQTLNDGQGGFTTGMAFDAVGNLYSTNFSASNVVKYLGPADPHTSSIWATNDPGGHNESILFDKSGNAYIGQPDGTHNIIKRDASGGFLARYAPTFDARGTDWIDLAADQKTMLYTSEGAHVQRFDVSTNTQLSNFSGVLPGANAFALRILPDGTVLVADGNMVVHLAADGTVLHTYDTSNTFSGKTIGQLFSLNLDPNGLDFWTGDDSTNQVYAVNIATGAIDHTWNVGAGDFFGLAVFGEVTAGGGGGGGGGKVPEPATILLLGSGLVGLWGARKKFKK